MKKMKYNLNGQYHLCTRGYVMTDLVLGLVGHLKTHFPFMYQLLCILNNSDQPPTEDEIAVAEGCKMMDPKAASEWLNKLEKLTSNLTHMFKQQVNQATVSLVHD